MITNNLRYTEDITLMAESKGELKSLLRKVKKESEIAGLKFNNQKTKIIASGPISSLLFSLLYCPALTSTYDYGGNCSFDSMDLCWHSNVSAFKYAV